MAAERVTRQASSESRIQSSRATNVAQLRAHKRINLRNQPQHFTKEKKREKKGEENITWFVNFYKATEAQRAEGAPLIL